jgi:F0F1-type ATP synthase delta subunit
MAEEKKVWRFSPIQNVVNVKFGGGLAVEFGDKAEDASKSSKPAAP